MWSSTSASSTGGASDAAATPGGERETDPPGPITREPWTQNQESATIPTSTVTLVQGSSFAICDASGNITGRGPEGVFVADTRICSQLLLTVNDLPVEPLAVGDRSSFAASFVGRSADHTLLVFRDLWIGRGLRLDIRLRNVSQRDCTVVVRAMVGADLVDLFSVKEGRDERIPVTHTAGEGQLRFMSEAEGRGLILRADQALATHDGSLRWRVEVAAGKEWSACMELAAVRQGEEVVPRHRCGQPPAQAVPAARRDRWVSQLPRLRTDVPGLGPAYERAGEDIGALQLFDPDHPEEPVIAAGAPWFMTLFGRDSILTSWMALMLDHRLALATARTLARLQGTEDVPETEEQPGRILHEVRFSPGPSLALGDGDVYYGTADATPLFVMLVEELRRWGVPFDELRPLLPAVDAALDWLAGPGDPDGDGYVEYSRRSSRGLLNQGWKDSYDGVSFADGRLPEPPIALVEVQAYTYAAWRGGAALALAAGDAVTAATRSRRADDLLAQFDRDFWLPDRDAYAMALDRDKRPVDAVASNMGHCLWAGIVTDRRKAAAVARWLLSPEMFTGWGLRTLATSMSRYNPISYHNGSVWPHDTAIAVAGLRRAGCVEQALQLAGGLLAASQACDDRLPELFAGLTGDDIPTPVRYPASCSPQAWASAAPLLIARTLLGLEPDIPGGVLQLDPVLPSGATALEVTDMPLGGSRVAIHAERGALAVRDLPRGLALIRPAS